MNKYLSLVFLIGMNIGVVTSWGQCNFNLQIQLSPVTPGNVYCSYDTVTMTVADTFETYQWFYNFSNNNTTGTSIGGATAASFKIPISEWGFAYFYVQAGKGGCTEASPTVIIDSWAFIPPAIAHDPQSTFCNGDSTLISNAFGAFDSYQWYRDGEPIPGATGSSYWVTETGYYVLNASPDVCPHTVLSSGVGPYFEFEGPEPPVISLQGAQLVASSGPNFQWYLNGAPIQGAHDSTYTPVESGVYTVEVSDNSGCHPLSAPFAYTVTGIDTPAFMKDLAVYPNPVKTILHIDNKLSNEIWLGLLDGMGRELQPEQRFLPGRNTLNMADLPKGIYFCRIQSSHDIAFVKLVKE